ncbi:MAG: alpha/beta hydrolase [Cyclobacteriaceae bacterium]
MTIKFVFALLLAGLLAIKVNAQPDLNASKVDRNVVFGMYSGLALLMDVYYPENPNGYGVIHISGSGWTKPLSYDAGLLNHQGHVKIEGEALVAAGYTLFSVNHRAVPRFTYPAAVEDVQRAVRFIRFHAEDYGIDPDRIGAVGGSSGGHLVSMLGVLEGDEVLDDDTPINKVSAKVQCVIARAAPTDFTSGGVGEHFINVRGRDISDPRTKEYKIANEASPISHISSDDPPFLLVHGEKDDIVPIELSEKMAEKLKSANIPVKLIRVAGAGHGPGYPGATNLPDLQSEYVNWLDTHLKK